MQHEINQAKAPDFAEIWRDAEHRRADDIASGINSLKTIALFSGVGLLFSVVLASYGLEWIPDFLRLIIADRRRAGRPAIARAFQRSTFTNLRMRAIGLVRHYADRRAY
jgi:hypothetical protein